MGSKVGAIKAAARRIGVTPEEYEAQKRNGFKWCATCKTWKLCADFCTDDSRSDGLSARCRMCSYTRTTTGPGKAERQAQRAAGFAWCRLCAAWLPAASVRSGLCRNHAAEQDRHRYAINERYRSERRQHAHSRKRNVLPMTPEAQIGRFDMTFGKCAYCGAPATTWDHVVPVSRGGNTTPDNILPACSTCNSSKGDRNIWEWIEATGRILSDEVAAWLGHHGHL